jgi:hypothetical protein
MSFDSFCRHKVNSLFRRVGRMTLRQLLSAIAEARLRAQDGCSLSIWNALAVLRASVQFS